MLGDPEKFFMFLTIFMIKFRSLRENESMIAPCAWVSGGDGGEHGVFLVVTKTQEGTENDYAVAGDRTLLFFSVNWFFLLSSFKFQLLFFTFTPRNFLS
jgi:hypothetical protein